MALFTAYYASLFDTYSLGLQELKGGKTPEDLIWTSPEGVRVKPIYTKDDVEVRFFSLDCQAIDDVLQNCE